MTLGPRHGVMTRVLCLLLAVVAHQVIADCEKCALSKDERAMFRAHSDACLPQSRVDQKTVDGLLRGEAVDSPALRRHVYCVLLRCKMIGKDGKLLKNTALGKIARAINDTKMAASCVNQSGDGPEDIAWRLLHCGHKMAASLHPGGP